MNECHGLAVRHGQNGVHIAEFLVVIDPGLSLVPKKGRTSMRYVTIQTQIRDPTALAAACRRLGLCRPTQGTAQLYGDQATGLLVNLADRRQGATP